MSIRCFVFGHKPWRDGKDPSGSWLAFKDAEGNVLNRVAVCQHCGVFYAMPLIAEEQQPVGRSVEVSA